MLPDELKQALTNSHTIAADGVQFINDLREFIFTDLSRHHSQPIDFVRWVPAEKVRANDYNPNAVAKTEMTLLHKSIEQDGYCVEESTPILKADLTWAPAGSLSAGDKIIAFDEYGTQNGGGRKQRRYRTAYVTGNRVEASTLIEVRTDRGNLTVTPDHPFLGLRCYGKGYHSAEWIPAASLKPDDAVIYVMDPWQVDRSWESGWLAGFLDGEGTLAPNQEMSKRVVTKVFTVERPESHKWNSMVMARVDRMTEIMRLLGSVRPPRLLEKGGDFWEGAALSSGLKNESKAIVLSTHHAGKGNIARLSTSTKTYIANGFAVHNTQPIVTVWDKEADLYIIVDGFHRFFVGTNFVDIAIATGGYLPVVVIDKDINDRMASTVRHNRARGKHSTEGMSSMIFEMLENGWEDAEICNELGMEPEELLRLKHITGFSKLFENVEYKQSWVTSRQIKLEREAKAKGEL